MIKQVRQRQKPEEKKWLRKIKKTREKSEKDKVENTKIEDSKHKIKTMREQLYPKDINNKCSKAKRY
ncbi:hypothetical protein HYE29_04005 [Mycoplasmopsis bovis]|nr:hypothetical protein [Mycoplasmopsis bovis]QQH22879.1 hypothetical protein HYE29_04005 [Mycoplasmopsis bovis]